jgi:hypothetical protein
VEIRSGDITQLREDCGYLNRGAKRVFRQIFDEGYQGLRNLLKFEVR